MTTTDGSRSISSNMACLMASRNVTCVGVLASPLPPFATFADFVARAMEVFAMGYLRPFFAALLATGFFAGLTAGLSFAADFAAVLTATFAVTLAVGFALVPTAALPAGFLLAPFFDFAAALGAVLITSSVTTSS